MLSSVWDLVNLGHLFKCAFSGGFGYTRLKVWNSGLQIHTKGTGDSVCVCLCVCAGEGEMSPRKNVSSEGKACSENTHVNGGEG